MRDERIWAKLLEMADDLETLAEVRVAVSMDYCQPLKAYTYGLSIAGERVQSLDPMDLLRLLRAELAMV